MKDRIIDFAIVALIAIWAMLLPIHGLMLGVGVLIFADTVTGITKAFRKRRKISSRRGRATIGKFLIYQLVVISGFALDRLAENDTPLIAKALAIAIGLTEMKSIAENVKEITGLDIYQIVMEKFKPKDDTEK